VYFAITKRLIYLTIEVRVALENDIEASCFACEKKSTEQILG
jgi:hypothetical protein